MRRRWIAAGIGTLWLTAAATWHAQRQRRADMSDLDQRLAGQIERLGERESELERQVADLRKQELELEGQVSRLGQQEDVLEAQVNGIAEREERLQREIEHLRVRESDLEAEVERQMMRIKDMQHAPLAGPSASWDLMLPRKNFNILVRLAQQQLSGVQVHHQALQAPQRLNSGLEKNWLSDAWRALGSLHEYASSDHEFRGDYLRWTSESKDPRVWHVSRIAMRESESTMHKHGATRVFPVDTQVDPSGLIEMQAHLKIQAKGSISPRIFFYDDTEGETGLVHIGFIGPHDLVPVSSHK